MMKKKKMTKAKVETRGRPPVFQRPPCAVLRRLYVKEGRSIQAIAKILNIDKDRVHRALKAAAIERRSPAKRSRLRTYSLDIIEKTIRADGMKAAAAALGVSLRTLQYYRAGLRGGTNLPAREVNTSGKSGRKKVKNRGKGQK